MLIAAVRITLRAPWCHSLKEKRMIVRSLTDKIRNRFNVSVAEVDLQDQHPMICLGIVAVASTSALADSILDHVIDFVETATEAEMTDVEREIR